MFSLIHSQKTEKSTAELEVELNANYAFDAITESGSKLIPMTGSGLQGLQNLGNSCYLNSVVQLLCSLPEVVNRYGTKPNGNITDHRFLTSSTPKDATNSIIVQLTKLANALTSGTFSIPQNQLDSVSPTDPKYRLAPRMLKHIIGKDHVDFRTAQQQDAAQFLQYLLEQLDRGEVKCDSSMLQTSNIFSFQTETRLLCSADQKIKYKESAAETIWSLRIPMEKAVTIPPPVDVEPDQKRQKQEDDKIIPTVTFADCLESWAAESTLDDYRWPHLQNAVHSATQKNRFQNFPRYLWVQAQRYELGPDWQPIKLEVNLDIPQEIDLNDYKATGPQEGETLVPEEDSAPAAAAHPEISEAAVGQLMDMGFSLNGCKRALMAVGGSDAEAAMNWIFEHNMDPDFNDPLPESGGAAAAAPAGGDDDAVVMSLTESLGCFTIEQVRAALKETNGAADRAADWLFSHMVSVHTR
jgi:ubiquitin carboxyl-terminal hydrolase 5/13